MTTIPVQKTYVTIHGRKIYSVIYGEGYPVLFLLGWLNDGDRYAFCRYTKLYENERNKYQFHFVHLSNFYKSSYSESPLTLDDYVDEVFHYAQACNLKKFHVIGHSAGGRIALGFTLKYPASVSKLVLLNAAGLNSKQPPQRQVTHAHISFSKFWAAPKHQKILQQTYRNVFTTSLKDELHKIRTDTLILWGAKDKIMPVSLANRLHSLIAPSKLIVLPTADHMTIREPETFGHIFSFFNNPQTMKSTAKVPPIADFDKIFTDQTLKEYRDTYLKLADNTTYRDFFTLPIPKSELKKLNLDAVHTLQALQTFADYVITKDTALLEELQLGKLDTDGVKTRDSRTLFNYARIDTIYDGEKFWFIEVNARRPQMYEDADWFSKALHTTYPTVHLEDNTHEIAESILAQYEINHTGKKPRSIFLVSDNPKWDYPYSLANILKAHCRKAEFIDVGTNVPHFSCVTYSEFIKQSTLSGHVLYFQDTPVDLIVLQNLCGGSSLFFSGGGISSSKARDAYLSGNLEVSSPPSALIIGSKLSLAFITDPAMQRTLQFSTDIVESLQRFPETTIARHHTTEDSASSEYVLKSTRSVSGGGVIMRQDERSEDTAPSSESLKYYVRQKKILYGCRNVVTWNDREFHSAGVTIEPFVVNNPHKSDKPFVTGYSARAIRKEHLGQVRKFNPADNIPEILFGNVFEV